MVVAVSWPWRLLRHYYVTHVFSCRPIIIWSRFWVSAQAPIMLAKQLCLFEHILVTLVVVTSAAAVSHVACQFCPVWRCHDSLCWKSEVSVHIYVLLYKKWYGFMYTRRGSAPPIKIRGSTADCSFEYLASQHINQPIKSWNHAKRFFVR